MKSTVWASVRVHGVHYWPDASAARSVLAFPHAHEFEVRGHVQVTGLDREIEFYDLADIMLQGLAIIASGEEMGGMMDFGARSCEQIGLELLDRLPLLSAVDVSEGNFAGAHLER